MLIKCKNSRNLDARKIVKDGNYILIGMRDFRVCLRVYYTFGW